MSPRSPRVCPAQHRPVVSQLSGRHAARDISEAGTLGSHSAQRSSLSQEYTLCSLPVDTESGPSAWQCLLLTGPDRASLPGGPAPAPAPASPNIRNNQPGLGGEGGGGSFLSAGEEDRGGGERGQEDRAKCTLHHDAGHEPVSSLSSASVPANSLRIS